jgi:hypothetical protein
MIEPKVGVSVGAAMHSTVHVALKTPSVLISDQRTPWPLKARSSVSVNDNALGTEAVCVETEVPKIDRPMVAVPLAITAETSTLSPAAKLKSGAVRAIDV